MTKEPIMDEKKPTTAESLRLLADWYEAHPDMPEPQLNVYTFGEPETPELVGRIARVLGTFEKDGDDTFLKVRKLFGRLKLTMMFYRPFVCTKRAVMKEVEVAVWDCPALLDGEREAA